MGTVDVVRHGPKELDGQLTTEGKARGERIGNALEKQGVIYEAVLVSELERSRISGEILAKKKSIFDRRVGDLQISPDERQRLRNPTYGGSIHALFSLKEFRPRLKEAGTGLFELIKEKEREVEVGKIVLVSAHEGGMIVAKRIMERVPRSKLFEQPKKEELFSPYQGFRRTSSGIIIFDFNDLLDDEAA